MPSFPFKKNTAVTFYIGLISQANTKILQANPTLAAGDVKVAIDDGAPANLATLPVVDADFTKRVKVAMSAAEMNGDRISIIFSDAAGAEWCDLILDIQTSVRQVDDLAFPNVSGRGVDVDATGGVEITPGQSTSVAAGGIVAASFGAGAIDAAAIATDAIGAAEFAQGAADKVWSSATRTLTAFSTALALSVWDVLETAIVTASSIGLKVKNNLDAAVSSRSSHAAADIWTVGTRTLTALGGSLVQEIWDRATSLLVTVGSIGKLIVDNLNATVSSRAVPGDAMTLSAGAITAAVIATDAIDADAIAAGAIGVSEAPNLDAAISTRATPAQVNAEVVDALNVDAYGEPGQGAPPASTTLVQKIGYIFKAFRNRFTQDATTAKLYSDDALTVDQKATVSDDGTTFDRGEMVSGP